MSNKLVNEIKENLKLREVAEFYGVEFNRRGFARCPFHVEKTASFTIHNEHYKCFGCGAYGSVIDFVMNYHGLKFSQALVKLDSDFHLGFMNAKSPLRQQTIAADNRRVKKAYTRWLDDRKADYSTVCDLRRELYRSYVKGYVDDEMWLSDYVEWLDTLLDHYAGKGVLVWEMKNMQNWFTTRNIS